jgi:putative flippase GtrA
MRTRRREDLERGADLRPVAAVAPRLSPGELAFRYAVFAAIAVASNLAAQRLVLAALKQTETVTLGWAPGLLDWALDDLLGVLEKGDAWRADISGSSGLVIALVIGTGVGLVVKYLLDKRWIFADTSSGAQAHARRFTLYAATGVVTTAIFWGTEAGAWAVWGTDTAREIGAVLGLAVGYVCKYQLDRRLVFTPEAGR